MINLLNSKYSFTTKNSNSKSKKNSKKNSKNYNNLKNLNKKSFIKKIKQSAKLKAKTKKYKPRSVESYCSAFYKTDILGKVNKTLYNSCKVNKYCRKKKCNKIDEKIVAENIKNFGKNYNMYVQGQLRSKCPLTVTSKNRKICETKALKAFYKKYEMTDLYDKLKECDKITCAKEKHIFYTNLFRNKQFKLKKKERIALAEVKEIEDPDPDMYLILNGDL